MTDTNPQFLDATNHDYHLQSTSQAINSGLNTDAPALDYDGVTRLNYGSNPDIGAYEYKSTVLPGDLNADGQVNASDLQLEVNVILGTQTDPAIVSRSDINGDGQRNASDLQKLVNIILGV